MKQPEDVKTLELPIDAKRGRGRPAKADALTPAERAKRYRENKKQRSVVKRDETEIHSEWSEERERWLFQLQSENRELRQQLELAESERNAALKAFSDSQDKTKLVEIKSDASLELQEQITVLKAALRKCLQTRASKKRLPDGLAESYIKLLKSDASR